MRRVDLESLILGRNPAIRAILARNLRPSNRKRPPGPIKDGAPTDPRRPSTLSGGAAAALHFED